MLSPLHCATTILTPGNSWSTEFLVQRLPREREKNTIILFNDSAKNCRIVRRINVGSKESALIFLSIKRLIINSNRNRRNISNSILSNSVENKVLVKYHNDLSLSFSTVHIKLKFVLSNKYIVRSKLLTRNMSRLIDELTELNTVIG